MRSPLTGPKSHQFAILVSSPGVSIPPGFVSDPTGPSGVSDVTSVTFAVVEPILVTAPTSSSPLSGPSDSEANSDGCGRSWSPANSLKYLNIIL